MDQDLQHKTGPRLAPTTAGMGGDDAATAEGNGAGSENGRDHGNGNGNDNGHGNGHGRGSNGTGAGDHRRASSAAADHDDAEHRRRNSHQHQHQHHNNDDSTAATAAAAGDDATRAPKKRRKVNHACVYCRRSHMTCDHARPCTRCIKRNIGHLCHDEPREADPKKARSLVGTSAADESEDYAADAASTTASAPPTAAHHHHHHGRQLSASRHSQTQNQTSMRPPSLEAARDTAKAPSSSFNAGVLGQGNLQLVQPNPVVSGIQPSALAANDVSQFGGFSDAWLTAQNHFHDMHNHNSYMIVPEVSGELQFLNDFLQSSMVDDANFIDAQNSQLLRGAQPDVTAGFLAGGGNEAHADNKDLAGGAAINNSSTPLLPQNNNSTPTGSGAMLPPDRVAAGVGSSDLHGQTGGAGNMAVATSTTPSRPGAAEKAQYYLQAADPFGNATPEQRMTDLLKAKYDAGLLKPFNYVKGYARLHTYLDSHRIAPASKQKIQRQLDRFRPKFREKMQALTDLELIYVEMWFEKTLMEYDRVFASMAVPACCWRRTGEIFRGNKEMAELIHVPVESLRDGKIALHEILTEESVVRYWEEFGTIAFDPSHDTLLTACSIKNPNGTPNDPIIQCCFSLKIRRDDHKIPSLIVGNFLPHDPSVL